MVEFGVQICQHDLTYSEVKEMWLGCEKWGFDTVFVYDHFYPTGGPRDKDCLEAWTLMSALANTASTIRFGALVLCHSYRHPPVLAKMASTLDHVSNGRLEFGIGAGWYKDEYEAYGLPFPEPSVRIAQLDEALQIIKMMWTEDKATFNGRYYHVKEAMNYPKPIQKPHPPILIGSISAGKLICRVAAKHANEFNTFASSPANCAEKLGILKAECLRMGRKFEDIEKSLTISSRIDKPLDQHLDMLEEYVKIGIHGFMLMAGKGALQNLKRYGDEVIPQFKTS